MEPIDIAIFAVFFLVTIFVGLKYRGKKHSFLAYAIGDKKVSTAVLTTTIVATWISGSRLFLYLEQTYRVGLYHIIGAVVGGTGGLLITGRILGPRMGKFLNNVSVPASLGQLYGRQVQGITGVGTILANIGYIAIQFKVINKVLFSLSGYERVELSIFAAAILILYAAVGGVRAVTFTDVVQFFTFGSLLPMLALVIWFNLASPADQVVDMLQTSPFFSLSAIRLREGLGWSPELWGTLIFIAYTLTPSFPPGLLQRMAMAKDTTQVKTSITQAAFLCLAIELFIMWIAILVRTANATLEPTQLLLYLVQQYAYPGFKALLGVGFLALAMSTADSALNASAVIVANDVVAPLRNAPEGNLLTARLATVGIGILALVVALKMEGLLKILFLFSNFYLPTAVIPMLLAVFGFQTSRRVVLMAMGAGIAVVVACLTGFERVDGFFPGMLANLVVMLGAHYLLGEPGGWEQVAPDSPLVLERAARRKAWQRRLQAIRTFKLYPYLQQLLPQYEGIYTLVGFYAMAASYLGLYTIDLNTVTTYKNLYEALYPTVLLASTLLLTLPIWPASLKNQRLLIFFWPISIAAIFFFAGMLLVILSHFHPLQVMVTLSNFLLVALFLPGPLALLLACSGTSLAVWLFQQYTGEALPWGALGLWQLRTLYVLLVFASLIAIFFAYRKALYQIVYSTLIGLLFARKQQRFFERRLQDIAMHCSDATQGLDASVSRTTVMHLAYHIDQQVKDSVDGHDYLQASPKLQKLVRNQQQRAAQGIAFFKYFKPTAYAFFRQGKQLQDLLIEGLRSEFIAPRLECVSMSALVQSVVDDFLLSHKHVVVSVDLETDFKVYVSESHFRYTLLQVLRFCTQSELKQAQKIWIWLSAPGKVYVRLIGSAISTALLKEIFQLFPSMASHYVADVELGLAEVLLLSTEGKLRYRSGVEEGVEYTEFELDMLPVDE